jgi:hypothetical protein
MRYENLANPSILYLYFFKVKGKPTSIILSSMSQNNSSETKMQFIVGRRFNSQDGEALLEMPLDQMKIGHYYRLQAYLHWYRLAEKLISIQVDAGKPWDKKPLDLSLLVSTQTEGIEAAAKVYQKVRAYCSRYLSPDFGLLNHAKWVLELPLNNLLKSIMQKWEVEPFGPMVPILRAQFALLSTERRDLLEGRITPITTMGGYLRYIRDIHTFVSGDSCPSFDSPPPAPREVYEQAAAFYTPVALDTLSPGDRHCTVCDKPLAAGGSHEVCRLACGHIFGLRCIELLMTETFKCPTCGRDYEAELHSMFHL